MGSYSVVGMEPARSDEEATLLEQELALSSGRPWPVRTVSAVLVVGVLACVALLAGPGKVLLPVQTGGFMSAAEELAPRKMLKVTKHHDETVYGRTHDIDFAADALTNDSVVIVDDGATIYLWVGSDHDAKDVHWAEIEAKDYARGSVVKNRKFTKPEHMEDVKVAVEKALATPLMHKVTVKDDKAVLTSVALDKNNFDSTSVFIIDTGKADGVFLWTGKNATESVTKPAQEAADKLAGSDEVTAKSEGDEDKDDAFGELFDQAEEPTHDGDDGKKDGALPKGGSPKGGSWSCLLLAASILLMN